MIIASSDVLSNSSRRLSKVVFPSSVNSSKKAIISPLLFNLSEEVTMLSQKLDYTLKGNAIDKIMYELDSESKRQSRRVSLALLIAL